MVVRFVRKFSEALETLGLPLAKGGWEAYAPRLAPSRSDDLITTSDWQGGIPKMGCATNRFRKRTSCRGEGDTLRPLLAPETAVRIGHDQWSQQQPFEPFAKRNGHFWPKLSELWRNQTADCP